MKTLLTIAALALLLGGCAKDATMSLDLDGDGQKETVTADRNVAAIMMNRDTQQARRARYDAKIEIAKARQEEAKARAATTIIEIDSAAELEEYNNMERERMWAAANERLADIADSQSETLYAIHNPELKPTVPMSGAAEFMSVTLGGVADILDKPASMVGVSGYLIGSTAQGIAKGNGDRYTLSDNARMDSSANTASVGRDGDARSSTSESVSFAVEGEGTSGSLDNSKPTTVTNTSDDDRTTTISRTNTETPTEIDE